MPVHNKYVSYKTDIVRNHFHCIVRNHFHCVAYNAGSSLPGGFSPPYVRSVGVPTLCELVPETHEELCRCRVDALVVAEAIRHHSHHLRGGRQGNRPFDRVLSKSIFNSTGICTWALKFRCAIEPRNDAKVLITPRASLQHWLLLGRLLLQRCFLVLQKALFAYRIASNADFAESPEPTSTDFRCSTVVRYCSWQENRLSKWWVT